MTLKYSSSLFSVLGVTQWSKRSDFFQERSIIEPEQSNQTADTAETLQAYVEPEPIIETHAESLQKQAHFETVAEPLQPSVILIGYGIQSYWEDEFAVEWLLWENIVQAMGWQELEVLFVDSSLLMGEDQLFATVEEIVALGMDLVLSMDSEHEINEVLAEGSEVLQVPDFDLMLSDPHAKKSFYQQALRFNASLSSSL